MIEELINRSLMAGKITKSKIIFKDDSIDQEYIIGYNGMIENLPEGEVIVLRNNSERIISIFEFVFSSCNNCTFFYIKTSSGKERIYFLHSEQSRAVFIGGEYEGETAEDYAEVIQINNENRDYCIDLTTYNSTSSFYINFITTLPHKCSSFNCGKLSGLFKIIYQLLNVLDYHREVYLMDDVMINGEYITAKRIRDGKPEWSIYEKYGFKINPTLKDEIRASINNPPMFNVLTRNILMKADNASMFNKC